MDHLVRHGTTPAPKHCLGPGRDSASLHESPGRDCVETAERQRRGPVERLEPCTTGIWLR